MMAGKSNKIPLQEAPVLISQPADFHLQEQREISGSKYDACQEILQELTDNGFQVTFSIPRELLAGKTHLTPNKTWIQDRILAGTVGIPPYNPEGNRILCVYKGDINKIALKPRLTGPECLFQGVVATLKSIPLHDCILIDTATGKKTSLVEINTKHLSTSIHNQVIEQSA